MKLLVQRVSEAGVDVDNENIATISNGILVFVGFDPSDSITEITKLTKKLLNYKPKVKLEAGYKKYIEHYLNSMNK